MYTLLRKLSFKKMIFEQVPTIIASMFIAEMFYKFHSFTLECLAFLATWYVVDRVRVILSDNLKIKVKT